MRMALYLFNAISNEISHIISPKPAMPHLKEMAENKAHEISTMRYAAYAYGR
jgi:hypothetical protein